MERKIEISTKTVGFAVLLILGIFFILQLSSVVVSLFLAFLFSSALSPIVRFIERLRVPRVISVPLVFIIVLSLFFLTAALIIPPLVYQLIKFFESLPNYLSGFSLLSELDLSSFSSQFTTLGQNIFKLTKGVFNDVLSFVSIFVLTFYMLFERKNAEKTISVYFGDEKSYKIARLAKKIENALGAWARGQFVLCVIIGVATYLGLRFMGIDYALPLAIIAGVLEMVPMIGPIISAIPAVIVAFSSSMDLALLTMLLYLLIQQAENHLIVPFVMKKAIGLSPLVTIAAIMVGGSLAGVAGMLLAIPILVIVQTAFSEFTS